MSHHHLLGSTVELPAHPHLTPAHLLPSQPHLLLAQPLWDGQGEAVYRNRDMYGDHNCRYNSYRNIQFYRRHLDCHKKYGHCQATTHRHALTQWQVPGGRGTLPYLYLLSLCELYTSALSAKASFLGSDIGGQEGGQVTSDQDTQDRSSGFGCGGIGIKGGGRSGPLDSGPAAGLVLYLLLPLLLRLLRWMRPVKPV